MGWNDHEVDVLDVRELPADASSTAGATLEVDDDWLAEANEDQQFRAMGAWFLARYRDPADETPYSSEDGGYLFIHGGPYDPEEELVERFGDLVSKGVINKLVSELHGRVGTEWAPIDHESFDEYDYDEAYGVDVAESSDPLARLELRLGQIKQILLLQGSSDVMDLARKLAFGYVITALESYLWETVLYWLEHDEKILENVVTQIPHFRDSTLKLGDIFRRYIGLKDEVKGYLQNIVWHNWKSVVPLFSQGLVVIMPSLKQFDKALLKRHDIIHRSGYTKTGDVVTVDASEVDALCAQILKFARDVTEALSKKPKTTAAESN